MKDTRICLSLKSPLAIRLSIYLTTFLLRQSLQKQEIRALRLSLWQQLNPGTPKGTRKVLASCTCSALEDNIYLFHSLMMYSCSLWEHRLA
ncbi:hypothetical protein CEXT_763541 [Caerostris extrusa]|uniref:Uncharacterized protein n=1 Tax=Caerostris extrusa TaxID=172846 RepID=A0AAV4VZS1_CAEEX|nr:hypothetical protein CEXT_763541 [Caerostris extrusa]